MTQISTEYVVRNIHESNDAAPTGNLKYSTKESIIEDIRMRAEDGIIAPSNAELLIKLINNADDLNEAISIAALGTMYKRTGLYFDVRLEKQDSNTIHYLKKNEKYSFYDSENSNLNRLIIGDNYHALQNLMVMHSEPFVDVIYIDPPYGKDSMGQFAKTNYKNGITRDNLLSQLYPRLILSRQLLKDDGLIIISIDDKNEAYIKCLMDDIFGEHNFVASCPRKTVSSKTTKSDHELQKLYDYLLIYVKSDETHFTKHVVGTKTYPFHDTRGDYYMVPLQDNGPHGTRTARPNLYYPIYQTSDGRLVLSRESEGDIEYLPAPHKGEDGRWMWSKNKFVTDNADLTVSDKGVVSIKHYYTLGEDTNKYQPWKNWLDKYLNAQGTTELSSIIGANLFANPKPVDLVKWCVNLSQNKNAVILDFYAGSGTTGQAVLELNKEDGGNRTFILCTNNEPEDGYIADNVTTKRLKRVMTGCCYDGTSDFPWAQKNKPLGGSLEVYDICSVANFEMTRGKTPFDVIDETAYGKKRMELQDKIKWVCENFEQTQPILAEKDKEATS